MGHEFYPDTCVICGVDFQITKAFESGRRKTGANFYCPNGHPLAFPKTQPEIETLKARIAALESELKKARETITLRDTRITELEVWEPSKETA